MTKLNVVKLLQETSPEGITRSLSMISSYDLRKAEKNYGIHNAELSFVVKRGQVAVAWNFGTGWWLKELRGRGESPDGLGTVATHSPVAVYEGQISVEGCDYTGGRCFGSCSYCSSGELFDKFVGEPGQVWVELEKKLKELELQVQNQLEDHRNFS